MRSIVFLVMLAGCASHSRPIPHAPPQEHHDDAPPALAADAAARIAAGSAALLSGDRDRAISELERAGGSLRALALLSRAYVETGHAGDAERALKWARAIGKSNGTLRLAHDTGAAKWATIADGGAYVLLEDDRNGYTNTLWDVLGERPVKSMPDTASTFGRTERGELVMVTRARLGGGVVATDPATGVELWRDDKTRVTDAMADGHGRLWFLDADRDLGARSLADGTPTDYKLDVHTAVSFEISADASTAIVWNTLWDIVPKKKLMDLSLGDKREIRDESLSPDGSLIALANVTVPGYDPADLVVMNRDGSIARTFSFLANSLARFQSDGTLLAADREGYARFDVHDGRELHRGKLARVGYFDASGHALAEAPWSVWAIDRDTRIAQLGGATALVNLAWTTGGMQLTGVPADDDHAKPSIDLLTGVALPARLDDDAAPLTPELIAKRVFLRDANHRAVRYLEAPVKLDHAAVGTKLCAASGEDGAIYLWDAESGEGLGSFGAGDRILSLALRPDDHTLAVARQTGGVELWDLGSRTSLVTLAIVDGVWFAFTADGRVEGDAAKTGALGWELGDERFPSVSLTPAHALVADALAHAPAPLAVTRTAAAVAPKRACIADYSLYPVHVALNGNVLSYCLTSYDVDPYCFQVDLAADQQTPVTIDLDLLAHPDARPDDGPPTVAIVKQDDDGNTSVCLPDGTCHSVAQSFVSGASTDRETLAVSDDGKYLARFGTGENTVDTLDVATGKQIAHFKVKYIDKGGGHELEFWSDDVLAISKTCAGPCSHAMIYDVHGRQLGPLATDSAERGNEFGPVRFYDDVWAITGGEGTSGLVLQDAKTGRIVAHLAAPGSDVIRAADSQRLVLLGSDKSAGDVVIIDRKGKVLKRIPAPTCRDQ
jgi:WD40 repeat protein